MTKKIHSASCQRRVKSQLMLLSEARLKANAYDDTKVAPNVTLIQPERNIEVDVAVESRRSGGSSGDGASLVDAGSVARSVRDELGRNAFESLAGDWSVEQVSKGRRGRRRRAASAERMYSHSFDIRASKL